MRTSVDNKSEELSDIRPTILSFGADLPNICSLIGLFCSVLCIYFALVEMFQAAMISMIWAVCFDWTDGIIARKMNGRTEAQGLFGGQLDSLIDIVSFGICPAIILLSYGSFSPLYLPGAFIIVAAAALRLSYFNVFGLVDKSSYMGMALDNNGIILPFIFLFSGLFSHSTFLILLYIFIVMLAAFNVAPIKTPKLVGRWFHVLIVYATLLTIILGWQWYHV